MDFEKYMAELIESIKALHKEFLAERANVPLEEVWTLATLLEDFHNTAAVTYEERA